MEGQPVRDDNKRQRCQLVRGKMERGLFATEKWVCSVCGHSLQHYGPMPPTAPLCPGSKQ